MVHIDTNLLKHNPEAIKSCIVKKNNMTIATKNIRIMFLDAFLHKNLAEISDYINLIGMYAIIDDNNNYAASLAPCMQKLLVDKIEDSTCTDGQLYKILYIDKDTVFIDNNSFVIDDAQLYQIADILFIKGAIPWYLSYYGETSIDKIFDRSKFFNKSSIAKYKIVFSILTSVIARGKNKSIYYRNSDEFLKQKPQWVDMKNIYHSLPSTSSKLIGGYYGAAVGVAILKPEKTVSSVETILMGKEV